VLVHGSESIQTYWGAATSFGELSFLPLELSAMLVIEPSSSVRVTRRPLCSQVIGRSSRSMVLPLVNRASAYLRLYQPLYGPADRSFTP
jgi:hypothetical protein